MTLEIHLKPIVSNSHVKITITKKMTLTVIQYLAVGYFFNCGKTCQIYYTQLTLCFRFVQMSTMNPVTARRHSQDLR